MFIKDFLATTYGTCSMFMLTDIFNFYVAQMKTNSYNKLSSSDLFIVQNPCPIQTFSHLGPILNFSVKGHGHIRPFKKKNVPKIF